MNKKAAKQLQRDINRLAHEAFLLDLYETGKRLCDCAERLRQLLIVAEEEKAA
jgi:hypothetical protein